MNISDSSPIAIHRALQWWFSAPNAVDTPVFLTGGAVRDHLLKRDPADLDLTSRNADALARRLADFHKARLTRLEKDLRPEATWRVTGRMADGTRMEIDISSLVGGELLSDLHRRDFTLNAMAIEVSPEGRLGRVHDPLGGQADLAAGILRQTGPTAFVTDPLRIMRAFRFAATHGLAIEADTEKALQTHRHQLTDVATERITHELLEILKTPHSRRQVRGMDQGGILEVLFPEIGPMKDCLQNDWHHLDVWQHSLAVMANCEWILNDLPRWFGAEADPVQQTLTSGRRWPLLKLAALLHDVGKPSTRGLHPDTGRITFYGHDADGAAQMEIIASRLRFSITDTDVVRSLIAEHQHVLQLAGPEVTFSTRIRWLRRMADLCVPAIILGLADTQATLGPASSAAQREHFQQWSADMIRTWFAEIRPRMARKSLITGHDVMARGLPAGPAIGQILNTVRQAQDEGAITRREEALEMADELIASFLAGNFHDKSGEFC